jgi:hypothetical protein
VLILLGGELDSPLLELLALLVLVLLEMQLNRLDADDELEVLGVGLPKGFALFNLLLQHFENARDAVLVSHQGPVLLHGFGLAQDRLQRPSNFVLPITQSLA